jgi:tetratricopeptide (TPR) repeat protein
MALSLVAARAATNPAFRLSDLASELRPESGRLDSLTGPDEHSGVRVAIRSSYLALGPEDARVFRLLAVDLLRDSESPEARRQAALGVLGHYLATARQAAMLMDPQQYPISLLPMVDHVVLDRVTGYDEALAWFTAMHESLLEVAWFALTMGYPEYGWRLVWCLVDYADRRAALWWPWANLAEHAVVVVAAEGDLAGVAQCHRLAGQALARLGEYDRAGDLDRALATCLDALQHAQASGDRPGEADTWDSLALAYQRLGRLEDALAAAERAAEQYEALGDHVSAARSGLQAGDLSEELGDRSRARDAWQQALAVVGNADPEISATLTQRLDGVSG